jgi:hypothetical protein
MTVRACQYFAVFLVFVFALFACVQRVRECSLAAQLNACVGSAEVQRTWQAVVVDDVTKRALTTSPTQMTTTTVVCDRTRRWRRW